MHSHSISNEIQAKIKSTVLDIFDIIVKALIAILIIVTFICKMCTVEGNSMANTLHHQEQLIISNLFYSPKEGDVIVFHDTNSLNEPVVKRVIATGGKWIKIDYDNMITYVSNDEIFDSSDIVDESAYVFFDNGQYELAGSYTSYVPEGYLFVMGDNRNNSSDSRFSQIGLVDERTVLGKVIIRITPIQSFGFIR